MTFADSLANRKHMACLVPPKRGDGGFGVILKNLIGRFNGPALVRMHTAKEEDIYEAVAARTAA